MRPYTIIRKLVLFFGAGSVVARTLPEQRSEINIRAAGGHGFSNPLTKLEDAGTTVDTTMSEAKTPAAATGQLFDILTPSHPLTDYSRLSLSILIIVTITRR
jgi:hypothetical protein